MQKSMTNHYLKIADKILEDNNNLRQKIAVALEEQHKVSQEETIKVMRQIQEAFKGLK